jgi:cysteine-rich repeat protein
MPSGIRNVIILLAILTLVLVGVSIYVGVELSRDSNIDSDPAEASEACGNNTCDAAEACDGVEQCTGDGDFSIGDCRNDCTYCGDGVVQAGEECDDSNDNDDDDCSNSCKSANDVNIVATPTPVTSATPTPQTSITTCGNLACDGGESCDGENRCTGEGTFDKALSCRLDCTYCGDGQLQSTEECDDGNTVDSDACSNTCILNTQSSGSCGDGIIQESEQCDRALSSVCSNGLQCSNSCECVQSDPSVQDEKVCGATCTSNNNCPVDNICESGKCVLLACSKSLGGLSGNIGQSNNQASVCTSNGCEIVQCGGACGPNSTCPNGLSCNLENKCVFTYCISNQCTNQCQLPQTSLSKEDMKAMLQALIVILFGLVGYQIFVINNSFSFATHIANLPILRGMRKEVRHNKEKKKFESSF